MGVNDVGKSAYIKFVEGSTVNKVTLSDVKKKLEHYIEMTTKTGQQLGWNYQDFAFPYTIIEKPEGYLYLKGNNPDYYRYILFGVGEKDGQHFIHVVLPEGSTHGDKGKANEFCKYLAKDYQAELHMFNGRILYYNPRKP